MCRKPLEVVVCIPLPAKETAGESKPTVNLFETAMMKVSGTKSGVTAGNVSDSKKAKLVFNEEAKMHAPKGFMNSVLKRLNEFRCPPCGQV